MLIVVWLPKAVENRRHQLAYLSGQSPSAAIEQGDLIEQQVEQLVGHPELGRAGRRRGTCELVIGDMLFVVVYRVTRRPKRVEIMRVLRYSQQR